MDQVELPADDVLSLARMDEETALFNSNLLAVLSCSGVRIKTRVTAQAIDFELPFKTARSVRFEML